MSLILVERLKQDTATRLTPLFALAYYYHNIRRFFIASTVSILFLLALGSDCWRLMSFLVHGIDIP